jgi:S1-C subfamily serine protease
MSHPLIFTTHVFGAMAALLLVSACPNGNKTPDRPGDARSSKECANRDLKPTWVQQYVAPNVVRVISDANSSGTGFLLASPDPSGASLIVTNYHVVAGGMTFQAELQASGGEWVRVTDIEVVKADPRNDLVLMKVPRISTRSRGLRLSNERIVLGQEIAALGFPGVAGSDFVLTVETGGISAVRSMGGQEYLSTNANINPGNSGGPVVDACGNVVGVVVAKVTTTERTGLVIPVGKLAALQRAYLAPRRDDEADIRTRLADFMMALQYGEEVEAAAFMSRTFLLRQVAPVFMKDLQICVVKIDQEAHKSGRHAETLSVDELGPICARVLSEAEIMVVYLGLLMTNGHINQFQALQVYFSVFVAELFGEVRNYRIDRVRKSSDDSYEVRVTVESGGEARHWVFDIRYEWGDWSIENIRAL